MSVRNIDAFADRMLEGAPYIETIAGAELGPSAIQGRGMFARRAWAAGEVLCILDGQVVDVARHPAVIDALEWNALSPQLLLVRALRTSYGFINHGSRPNTRIDADGRTLRACRPIAPGDELTMDYFEQPVPPAYLAGPEAAVLKKNS
ncbi:SET domain-containing protein [Variovorax paradoxus]|nr:SET domain-containing protein [Variovorax paradoxus]